MKHSLIYEIDHIRRYVHVTYRFQPDFAEWEHTMDRILGDPDYVLGFGILLDRRYLMYPADAEYMQRLAAYVRASDIPSGGARWAILVTDDGSFAMGRMAEQLVSSERIRAFRELEKAREWAAMVENG